MVAKIYTTLLLALCGLSQLVRAQVVNNSFEENIGANTYFGGLGTINWVNGLNYGIANHDGADAFLSAVGNDYFDLGLEKDLGGIINDSIYDVSFYIGKYYGSGVTFSNFSQLIIGGFDGTMQWNQTPEPTIDGVWYQWSGTYTPDISDMGSSFTFTAVFDLYATHSIAIDGPVIASADFGTSAAIINSKHSLKVFPNPSHDKISIEAHAVLGSVRIFNLLGKQVLSSEIKINGEKILTLNIESLPAGIYKVIVLGEEGMEQSCFVKE